MKRILEWAMRVTGITARIASDEIIRRKEQGGPLPREVKAFIRGMVREAYRHRMQTAVVYMSEERLGLFGDPKVQNLVGAALDDAVTRNTGTTPSGLIVNANKARRNGIQLVKQ